MKNPHWPKSIQEIAPYSRMVRPPWSEQDYFRLSNVGTIDQGYINPHLNYLIAFNNNDRVELKGSALISEMIRTAGSLFIPHVLARITFLKNENFSN